MTEPVAHFVKHASNWSIVWGILLIVLGILAISSPFLAALTVVAVIAWLLVFAGIAHLVLAFNAERAGSVIWRLLVAVAYAFCGGYLLTHPALGVASLTLLLAALFFAEGILDIVLFFGIRSLRGSGWVLLDGVITVFLGLLIYRHWPSSSLWAIGTIVGVSLIVSGITRLMLAFAARRALKETLQVPDRRRAA